MNIKSIYAAVCDYFNPKPQIIEKDPSNERIDEVIKYYRQRYGWVFFLRNFFKVRLPNKDHVEFLAMLADTFVEGFYGIFKFIWSSLAFVAFIFVAFPFLIVWGLLSKVFELIFSGILKASREDNRIVRDACNPFKRSQEKENVCGTWRFTATCKNHDDVPVLEGFATGAYSYNASEDVKKQIEAFIEPLMVGELSFHSSRIDSENFTITCDYRVANHYPTPVMGSDEV